MTFCCSKTLMRVVQEGARELIGQAGLSAVVGDCVCFSTDPLDPEKQRMSFDQLAASMDALDATFGKNGGLGLVLRAGRASFSYFLREFGAETRLNEVEFRLLPTRVRLRTGMERLAGVISGACSLRVGVMENDGQWVCHVSGLDANAARRTGCVICHFIAGLLQEYLYWASGGKTYMINRFECAQENQAACAILINQQPLE